MAKNRSVRSNNNNTISSAATTALSSLQGCGARINGHGTHRITIEGVKELHGCEHTVIPDRI